jgi:predicted RNA polymerase sigma factor
MPDEREARGLLALTLLSHSRRAARQDRRGRLVLLAEQDRSRWDAAAIAEGTALVPGTLRGGRPGRFALQAAIAAVHAEADSYDATDWPQILGLYDLLMSIAPNPVTALNRAVALAEVRGPVAGLAELAVLESDQRLRDSHRLLAARAHMLEQSGDRAGAARCYREAASRTTSRPERRHLAARAAELST